jgi:hypothetical protein
VHQAGGNTFISLADQPLFVGDLSGHGDEHITLVSHPNGSVTFSGVNVCACTLAGTGLSGAVALPFSGTIDASGSTIGHFRIGNGTGGLANMKGVGTFLSSDGGASGTFSGSYHFDP